MTNVVERFRKMKAEGYAFVITFKYPEQTPVIEFTARRLNQSQINLAEIAALDRPTDQIGYQAWVYYELIDQLEGHITGWRAIDGGELPPFNRANIKEFLNSLEIAERVLIGKAYSEAVEAADAADEKKSESDPAPTPSS
jgi:hypothetical protein